MSERPLAGLRLLHVHAHPDDESSKGAAVTAMYVAAGVDVHVATCTGGEAGSILNPAMDKPGVLENIAAIRAAEMDQAREILGVTQDWLGFVDSGMPDDPADIPEGTFARVPLEEPVEALVRLIRSFKPQVMTTYDERGGYPHPDHIRCHEVSMAAYAAAADPAQFPDAGEPWQVLKVYFHHTFNRLKVSALHEAMVERGLESPYGRWLEQPADPGWDARVTTRVPCADFFGVRDAALIAHATQIDPKGFWFAVPRDLEREVWPTEDFELVETKVPVDLPEDDLFAGVPRPVAD